MQCDIVIHLQNERGSSHSKTRGTLGHLTTLLCSDNFDSFTR